MKRSDIGILLLIVFVLLFASYLHYGNPFLSYRKDAHRGLCVNNLRLIDHAKG